MSLKGSSSTSCVGVPVLMNYVDDSSLGASDESCNTSIKDERLDITECSLEDFKSELEDFDVNIKDEPFLEENTNNVSDSIELNVGSIIGKNTSGKKSLNNIIDNIKDKGEERTCIIVKNLSFNDTMVESFQRARETVNNAPSPNKELFNKTVRNFIVTSPDKLMDPDEANEHKTSLNQTVYNPCTGEIVALSNNMNISNKSNRNAKNSNLKIDHSKHALQRHKETHTSIADPHVSTSKTLLCCNLCSFVTHNLTNLKTHKKCHVKNKPIIQCDKCTFRSTKRALQRHKETHTSIADPHVSTSKTLFGCNLCSFVTHNLTNLKIHKMCHVKNKPIIQCDKCTFRSTRRALERHKKNHISVADPHVSTSKTPYGCNLCSHVTRTLTNLKTHKMCHVKKMPIIQCDKCTFRSTERALLRHKKTHISVADPHVSSSKTSSTEGFFLLEDNTFSCFICSFTTDKQQILKDHERHHRSTMEKHVSEKSSHFEATQNCSLCSFSTSDHVTLRSHLKKHQFEPIKRTTVFGRIIYDCRMCSYSRPAFSDINFHINSHRKNIPIRKCPKCDFRSTKCALRCHIQKCKTKNSPKNAENSEEESSKIRTVELSKSAKVSSKKSFKCAFGSFSTCDKLKSQLHINEHHFHELVVEHHLEKCKSANVDSDKDTLENAVDEDWQSEISFKSEKTNSDLHNSTKTHLNTLNVEPIEVVSNEIVMGENSFQSSGEDLAGDIKKDLFKPKVPLTNSGTKFFQCKLCSYGDKGYKNLTAHMNTHKKNLPILSCFNNCGFKSTAYAVIYHMKKCGTNETGNLFKCPVCTFSTCLRIKLKLHIRKRHFNKCFSCSYCSFFTQNRSHHVRHLKRHKKCPYCSFEAVNGIITAHILQCVHKQEPSAKIRENSEI